MKSPFPGMDPYLEQYWGDIHTRLMVYICDQIDRQLPGDLQARVEEDVLVDMEEAFRVVYPDVRVVEQPELSLAVEVASAAGVAVAEPLVIRLPDERRPQRHIVIVDPNSSYRVVTAIELLSPNNKLGADDDWADRLLREKGKR
jgi:hypothetical protein